MKNAIITGATSFIGIHLINELLVNGYFVTAVVRPHSINIVRLPINNKIKVIELDMNDISLLPNKVEEKQYEVFYHLAWEGARVPYRDDKLLQMNNYNNAIKAIEVARVLKCKVFVGTGSQAECGKCVGRINEKYVTNPTTEYGKAKLKAYRALSNFSKDNNMKFIWTRIFSVYGKYDYEGSLVMSALRKFSRNEDIKLTECKQNWDYIHVEDVANTIYMLGTFDCADGIYNIASGESKILKEYVLDMKRITNSSSNLEFGAIQYNSEGVVSFEPVVDKLRSNLDWSCRVNFTDGILNLFKYIKQEGTYEKN